MSTPYIEPLTVECYPTTGFPGLFTTSDGLKFDWSSWVLCEVRNRDGNMLHHAIFTGFHCDNYEKPGPVKKLTAHRWNPSYEDDEYRKDVKINGLFYWKPVSVVLPN